MFRYILKRLLYVCFVFVIVSIIMFGIYKLVPGDPARLMVGEAGSRTPEQYQIAYEAARAKLGLDQPVVLQYFKWFFNMLRGDFGYSTIYRTDVIRIVGDPMKNSMLLSFCTMILVFAITIPLGILTAVKKFSVLDNVVQVGTVVGYSLPSFVISLVCIFIFAIVLPVFPISGVQTPGMTGTPWELLADKLYHMCLPLIVSVLASLGSLTRYVRAAMIDALSQDYIRTARAKGLREKVVIYSHAFRNALVPLVTICTGWLVSIFSGSVIIESIFLWNGIGQVMISSLRQQDFSVVLAMNMFYVVLSLAANLIMDLSYGLVDPRVKLS